MMGTVKYYNLFQLKESMDPMYEAETVWFRQRMIRNGKVEKATVIGMVRFYDPCCPTGVMASVQEAEIDGPDAAESKKEPCEMPL